MSTGKCSLPTNDDLEQVIIRFGDNSSLPTVTVYSDVSSSLSRILSTTRSLPRRVSCGGVHMLWTCSSDTAVEQIESECNGEVWSNTMQGSVLDTRSVSPDASFTTTTREDCSFCLSPELAI